MINLSIISSFGTGYSEEDELSFRDAVSDVEPVDEDELICLFTLKRRATAKSITEWLARRYYEEFGKELDISVIDLKPYSEEFAVLIHEDLLEDVIDLLDIYWEGSN